MEQETQRVVIGMDPHKRSVTIEVMTADETVVGGGRFGTDIAGYRSMLEVVRRWPARVWAVEGCSGIGRHIALRLLADDQEVVDVPPKLSARARVFSTGQGRKTDATDAHSIALVGIRMAGLRPVVDDQQLTVLRILGDRRRSLGEDHTRMVSQLHHLLLELIPGGAKKDLSAAQAKAMLAKVRPRDVAGKARRRVATELIADLERVYVRKKAADKELKELVAATGTGLMDLNGIGPSGAARLLVEVGDITRFPDRDHFASWNGTAPIDASSGDQVRHRLSRGGNRQINRTLHIMATVQLRNPTEGRVYYDRRKADGKTSMEAMRALKRRLSNIVYRTMLDDAIAHAANGTRTGPGGQTGHDSDSSEEPAHIPVPVLRTSHFPDLPPPILGPHSLLLLDTEGCHERALCSRGGRIWLAMAARSPGSMMVPVAVLIIPQRCPSPCSDLGMCRCRSHRSPRGFSHVIVVIQNGCPAGSRSTRHRRSGCGSTSTPPRLTALADGSSTSERRGAPCVAPRR